MRETHVWSLGREDPLKKEMATHSSTLAWKIPWMEKPGRLQSMGSQRVGHDWATSLSFFPYMVFPVVMHRCESWKEGWAPKNWCFWTVVLEKTLESPLDCKKIQPVHPKGNKSWIFFGRTDAEAPILWPSDAKGQLIEKDRDARKNWRQEEKGVTEDEMVGWYHGFNGHEFEQTLGDSEGQGSLACSSLWNCRVGHKLVTETTITNQTWRQGMGREKWLLDRWPGGSSTRLGYKTALQIKWDMWKILCMVSGRE